MGIMSTLIKRNINKTPESERLESLTNKIWNGLLKSAEKGDAVPNIELSNWDYTIDHTTAFAIINKLSELDHDCNFNFRERKASHVNDFGGMVFEAFVRQ